MALGSILTAITTTSALDAQLAALLQRLGGSTDAAMNHALHTLVCYVSERTRDGVIAAPLADLQLHEDTLAALRQLPVVGEEHEYAPLILSRTHAWLYRYWLYETRLAKWIQQHIAQRSCAVPAGLLMFAMLASIFWNGFMALRRYQRSRTRLAEIQQYYENCLNPKLVPSSESLIG